MEQALADILRADRLWRDLEVAATATKATRDDLIAQAVRQGPRGTASRIAEALGVHRSEVTRLTTSPERKRRIKASAAFRKVYRRLARLAFQAEQADLRDSWQEHLARVSAEERNELELAIWGTDGYGPKDAAAS